MYRNVLYIIIFITGPCLSGLAQHMGTLDRHPDVDKTTDQDIAFLRRSIDSLDIDLDSIKAHTKDFVKRQALEYIQPIKETKNIKKGKSSITYSNFYSNGQNLQFDGEAFMQEMILSQAISIGQTPLSVSARFRTIDPARPWYFDKIFGIQFDVKGFKDQLLSADKYKKLLERDPKVEFLSFLNDKKTGAEKYIMAKAIDAIINDSTFIAREMELRKLVDRYNELKSTDKNEMLDSLTASQTVLNKDSLDKYLSQKEEAEKKLLIIDSLKTYYNNNISKLNVSEGAGQNITGILSQPDKNKDHLIEKMRENEVLSKTEMFLSRIKKLNIGATIVNESDFTTRQAMLMGLSLKAEDDKKNMYKLHVGLMQRRENALNTKFSQFNKFLTNGKYIYLGKEFNNKLAGLTVQPGVQYIRSALNEDNFVVSTFFSNNDKKIWDLSGEVAYSFINDDDINSQPEQLDRYGLDNVMNSLAGNIKLKVSLLKKIKAIAGFSAIGSEFVTLGNPLLINNRYICEAGVESSISSKINARLAFQKGNRLNKTGKETVPFNRLNFNVNYNFAPSFMLMVNYAPLSFFTNSKIQDNITETNFYSANIIYSKTWTNNEIEENLGYSNLKTSFNNSDTALINDNKYILNQGAVSLNDSWIIEHYTTYGFQKKGPDYFDSEFDLKKNISGKLQIGAIYTFLNTEEIKKQHGVGAETRIQLFKGATLALKYILSRDTKMVKPSYSNFLQTQLNMVL